MPLVVDSSVALTWCFGDEATQETDAILDLVLREGAVVPGLWHIEMTNILSRAERLGRIDPGAVDAFISRIDFLDIDTDGSATRAQRSAVLNLVRRFGLTAYDATYLELALRVNAKLATLDAELRAAAIASGITCLP